MELSVEHNSLLTSFNYWAADVLRVGPTHVNIILNFYSAYLLVFLASSFYFSHFHAKMALENRLMWQQRVIALFDAFFVSIGATITFLTLPSHKIRYDLTARNSSAEFFVSAFMAFLLWDLGLRLAVKSLRNMGYIAHHVLCLVLSHFIISFGMLEYYSICLMMFLLGDSLMWLKTLTGYVPALKESKIYTVLNYIELGWFIFRIFWANWFMISLHQQFGFANFLVGKPFVMQFPPILVVFSTLSFLALTGVFYYWLMLRVSIELRKFRS